MVRIKPSQGVLDELELVRDIRRARAEPADDQGIAHDEVVAELRARLER